MSDVETVEKMKKPLFGKLEKSAIKDPLWDNNPVTLQVLGICSALAVTTQVQPALIMGIAVTVVLAFSNLIISSLRKMIPSKIRIIVMLAIISTLVIIVDQILKAYLYDMSKQLSVFVGLIITNCILLGRAEGYAMQNEKWPSLLDGLGNGVGYGVILVAVASIREVLGNGSWFGLKVIPQSFYDMGYSNMGIMLIAPGAFIVLGLLIWAQRTISGHTETH